MLNYIDLDLIFETVTAAVDAAAYAVEGAADAASFAWETAETQLLQLQRQLQQQEQEQEQKQQQELELQQQPPVQQEQKDVALTVVDESAETEKPDTNEELQKTIYERLQCIDGWKSLKSNQISIKNKEPAAVMSHSSSTVESYAYHSLIDSNNPANDLSSCTTKTVNVTSPFSGENFDFDIQVDEQNNVRRSEWTQEFVDHDWQKEWKDDKEREYFTDQCAATIGACRNPVLSDRENEDLELKQTTKRIACQLDAYQQAFPNLKELKSQPEAANEKLNHFFKNVRDEEGRDLKGCFTWSENEGKFQYSPKPPQATLDSAAITNKAAWRGDDNASGNPALTAKTKEEPLITAKDIADQAANSSKNTA